MAIWGFFSKLVSPISNAYKANQERKAAKETAQAKLSMAKQDNSYQLEMSDKEWEAVSKQSEDGTWKDEYVTLIITSPLVLLFLAGVISGYTGDMSYLNAVNFGLGAIKELGVDMGELMYIVVLAAIGIKGVNILRK